MNRDSTGARVLSRSPRVAKRRRSAAARVLETAARLFAERGFTDTSMAEIARTADVSVGTLYNLFANKEALYRQLILEKGRVFSDRLTAALRVDAGLPDVLDGYIAAMFSVFRDEARFLRLYYQVSAEARFSVRSALPEETRALYEEILQAFAQRLERTKKPSPHALRTALACQAAAGELFLLYLDDPATHGADAVLADAKQIVRSIAREFVENEPTDRARPQKEEP